MEVAGTSEQEEEKSFRQQNNVLLRHYQIKLIEVAEKQNSIIFLPTGSGKTFIALWIIKSKSDVIRKPYDEGGKRTFFLVNTKTLVDQQGSVIEQMTDLKVGRYTGDLNVDFWDKSKWLEELRKHQVMVMTAQILLNMLNSHYISISNINVMVFDEVHHAVNEHPYRAIMKQFVNVPKEEHPLVLGLSATLLNGNVRKKDQIVCETLMTSVEKVVASLETTIQGTIATSEELTEVLEFSTCPEEKAIPCKAVTIDDAYMEAMRIYDEAINYLIKVAFPSDEEDSAIAPPPGSVPYKKGNSMAKTVKNNLEDAKKHLQLLGHYGGAVAALYHIIQFEKLRIVNDNETETELLSFVILTLNKARRVLMKSMPKVDTYKNVVDHSSPKVERLLTTLLEKKDKVEKKKEPLACIVFVERRVTAIVLCHIIKILSHPHRELDFINPDFMVGGQGNPMKDTRECLLEEMRCDDVIKRFSSNEINLLVATDVVEEGVDLRECNLVIKFDKPKDYRSYVQSKGRARAKVSEYFMFVDLNEFDKFEACRQNYQATEKALKELLIGKSEYRAAPSDDKISYELYYSDVKAYYVDGPESAHVTGEAAIQLVDRYCQMLPQDFYSLLSPYVWMKKVGDKRVAILQLPITSPLRENIEGDPKCNSKLAKRSVFVKAVEKLHRMRELTDDLLPIKRVINVDDYKYLFPHYVNEKIDKNLPQPGTTKRVQKYSVKYAECLSGCLPKPGVTLYLHVISTKPIYEKPGENRRKTIHEMLDSSTGYAMLSTKPLSKICGFPVILKAGQVHCNLLVNASTVVLNEKEIEDVQKFHFDIFSKLLDLVRECYAFDNANKEHSFFIVPVDKNSNGKFSIMWDIVRKREAFPSGRSPTYEERSRMEITKEKYNLTVVMPYYRTNDTYYLVTAVCDDMTPMTKFPDNYDSYYSYFDNKYHLKIAQLKQPLLEVKALSSGYNFIRPRLSAKTGGIKGKKKRQEEGDGFDEHLVPELCTHFPYPAVLWLKATLLPTILYRIMNFYIIDEFRKEVARETKLGFVELPSNASWADLEIDELCLKGQEENADTDLNLTINRPILNQRACAIDVTRRNANVWGSEQLPIDIERRMNEVSPCDLQYYMRFIQKPLSSESAACRISPSKMGGDDTRSNIPALRNIRIVNLSIIKPKNLQSGPELSDLIHAFTASKANDICSLERLETLGDSFLKFAAALFSFREFDFDEGKLVSLKDKTVGNKNLMYCARAKNFAPLINVNDFTPRSDWNPPLFKIPAALQEGITSNNLEVSIICNLPVPPDEQLSGNLSVDTMKQIQKILKEAEPAEKNSTMELLLSRKSIADKTVADCTEALIGCYLKNFGIQGGFILLKWLGVMPKATYEKLINTPIKNAYLTGTTNDHDVYFHLNKVDYRTLEKTLGYQFNEKSFLLEALTHSSYVKNRLTYNYQRLEFLGDAILDFLITCYIYEHCGNLTPGKLTDLRSALVNNVTFACLAVRYNFHKYLLSLSASLMDPIDRFVKYQISRNHEVDEAVMILLDDRDCKIAEAVEVPKVLGDIFESLAGAIFLDSGNSLEAVWKVFYPLMKKEIDAFSEETPKQPVRLLHEVARHKPTSKTIVLEEGPKGVMVQLDIIHNGEVKQFNGFGNNKSLAKRSAAKHALKYIKESDDKSD